MWYNNNNQYVRQILRKNREEQLEKNLNYNKKKSDIYNKEEDEENGDEI